VSYGKKEAGFTLMEMLLSVAIISILAGMGVPIYESFARRNDLDLTTQAVAETLRRAEAYARNGNNDSSWSVEVQSNAVTLFKGATYASRNTNYDETVSVPGSITLSGLGELQFAKLSAKPNTSGNIVLSSTTGDTRTITVNDKGTVGY
jgi:prepilin-type N-terminal cleavage/methylation domain-containing protein